MKTKWHVGILWSVLSLGLLCTANTYESPFARRKGLLLKLGTPTSTKAKVSSSSELTSRRRIPPSRSMRPAQAEAKIQPDFAFLSDVSVTCSTSDFVVRVKPAFYGLGAEAEELRLGTSCRSNGLLRPYGDLLFTYPLTACDAVRQAPQGYLVYKFVLHYEPSSKRFPGRAHRVDVDIECRYQRNHHVYQLVVKPTWQAAVMRKKLKGRPSDFTIKLMDDSWSLPAKPQVYQLGQTVNFQVSARHLPAGGKLYISSCYATPSSASESSLKYTFIDNLGCMVDSKQEPGASQFIYRTDKTLQFSLKAFQFTTDPDTEVSIHCRLSVASEEPSPAHKSCTYKGDRWIALSGDNSICECCDSQCVASTSNRAMMAGFASSDLLLVSDEPYTAEYGFQTMGSSLVSISREDNTTVSQHTDELNNHEYLWQSANEVKDDGDDEEEDNDDYMEEDLDEDELESRAILGMTTEPDLDEAVFRHGVLVEKGKEAEVKDWNGSGSGYDIKEEGEEEEGSEGREDEISETQQVINLSQKDGEVPGHWAQWEQLEEGLQRESQPSDSVGKGNSWKYTDRSEGRERTQASDVEGEIEDGQADVVDNDGMTWYFTWR